MNKSVIHTSPAPQAAGGELKDIVRLGVFLTDMTHFTRSNPIMGEYFAEPYPARAAVQVLGLQKVGVVEAEAIMVCLPSLYASSGIQ